MDIKRQVKRRLSTYSRLRGVSWIALKQAEKSSKDRFYHCLSVMLFSAFSLEAYLNHLGARELDCWDTLKRKLSPQEKLQLLAAAMDFEVDYSCRPFQTFKQIFWFRNTLVHAETELVTMELLKEGESVPLTRWEKLVTLEVAQQFHSDAKAIMTQLHLHSRLAEEPLFDTENIIVELRHY